MTTLDGAPLTSDERMIWDVAYVAFWHMPQASFPLGAITDMMRARHARDEADRAVRALRALGADDELKRNDRWCPQCGPTRTGPSGCVVCASVTPRRAGGGS